MAAAGSRVFSQKAKLGGCRLTLNPPCRSHSVTLDHLRGDKVRTTSVIQPLPCRFVYFHSTKLCSVFLCRRKKFRRFRHRLSIKVSGLVVKVDDGQFSFPRIASGDFSAIGFFGLPPLPGFGPRCPMFHTSFLRTGLFPQKLTRICTRRSTPVVRKISRRDFDRPTRWGGYASDHHVPHEFLRGSFYKEQSNLKLHACRLQQEGACGGLPR